MIGVNLSGAEFGDAGNRYGYDYIYPSEKDLDFYQSRGIELIRLPFKWERMQTTLGGKLSSAELGHMKTFLAEAEERGMNVILDLHNYGRFGNAVLGSDALSNDVFSDFWTKLATELKNQKSVIGYDLMNEPHDMGGAHVWPAAAQAAVDAIRTVDMDTTIYVEGDAWAGASNWAKNNAYLRINDPANNIVYEAHLYFDKDGSGFYKNSYDADGAYANIGVDRAQSFLDWLDANDAKGFIGEFSVPEDDPRWLTVMDNFLDELDARGVDATYWGAGPWWGDYPMALVGKDGLANPQLSILVDHLTSSDLLFAPALAVEDLKVSGSTRNDSLAGLSGDDVLDGKAGHDHLDGEGGSDVLMGEPATTLCKAAPDAMFCSAGIATTPSTAVRMTT